MKAVETIYRGRQFRSQLEARWAVFFDTLGIDYRYELEGFDLNGVYYLPDFWLPKQNCWVVIRPNHLMTHSWNSSEPRSNNIADKCGQLAVATNKNVYLLEGEIDHTLGRVFTTVDDSGDWYEDHSQWWCICRKCDAIDICFEGKADRIYCRCKASSHPEENKIIDRAYTAAQEAFFQ